jgi:hypothetical protein
VAVADGVSNSPRSDLGARVAVNSAARVVVEHLHGGGRMETIDATMVFRTAAGEMVGAARHRGLREEDLCCILLVAVIPSRWPADEPRPVWTAQIGDVSVWGLHAAEWNQFTGPQKGGLDKNSLDHVLPFDPDAVTTTTVPAYPSYRIVVMTDGLSETLVNIEEGRRFFADRWSGRPPHAAAFLLDLCYDAPGQIDDRTAVTVWVGVEGPPPGRRSSR